MRGFFVLRKKKSHPPLLRSSEEEIPTPPSSVVLRRKKSHPPSSSFFGGRNIILSLLPSDLWPILRGRRSKMGGYSIFGSEDRRLKMRGNLRSSAPKIENGGRRSSAPKNEERKEGSLKNPHLLRRTPPFFEEPLPFFSSKNPLSSLFVLRVRRSNNLPPSSIFNAEDWFENRCGPRGRAGLGPTKQPRRESPADQWTE